MIGDRAATPTYADFMASKRVAYIVLRLSTKNPIEIGDFVSEFTSVASQYDKFMRQNYPDLAPEAQVFVKQVKAGSIVATLLPFLPLIVLGAGHEIAQTLEHINAVNEFVRHYGGKVKAYFKKDGSVTDASRSDLKDFLGTVSAVAKDPDGKAAIESAVYEDGKQKIRTAFRFTTKEAVRAVEQIERHRERLEHRENADYQRVLMVFKQANVKATPVGKRTGERVVIEGISDQELPLIYASDLAEQRIKHEINEADENIFKKGFDVDVNVQTMGGRPVAYRVTNLHQVIDLPDEP